VEHVDVAMSQYDKLEDENKTLQSWLETTFVNVDAPAPGVNRRKRSHVSVPSMRKRNRGDLQPAGHSDDNGSCDGQYIGTNRHNGNVKDDMRSLSLESLNRE
jgi:hypothetical protein